MKVRQILENKRRSGSLLGVGKDAKVGEAIDMMVENDTGSCLVLEDGKLYGLITFREVLQVVHAKPDQCLTMSVSEIMNSNPDLAAPDDTIDQIRNLMTSKHIRYLPVMQDGKLTDVISFYDVARTVAKQTDFENRMLKQYISDWPEDSG